MQIIGMVNLFHCFGFGIMTGVFCFSLVSFKTLYKFSACGSISTSYLMRLCSLVDLVHNVTAYKKL